MEYIICSRMGWDHWTYLSQPVGIVLSHLGHILADMSQRHSPSRVGSYGDKNWEEAWPD